MKRTVLAATALLAALLPAFGHAADIFPTRPVMLVVPFPPGGSVELIGRPLAAAMEKVLKQPVVINNRVGGAGAVGTSTVANSEGDGYKLLFTISSILIIPEADKLFDRKPAYTMAQLQPVARFASDPSVLTVRTESPWKTVKDLVDEAKKRPGQMTYSSSGVYGSTHVPAEMFTLAAGIRMRHVPFTGGGPATNALLGGHVDMHFQGLPGIITHINSGRLRALAVTTPKRSDALANVPTLKETGLDVDYSVWHGLFAPAKTPAPQMKVIRDAARAAAKDPDLIAAMAKISTPVAFMDTPEFEKFVAADTKQLADVVRKIGRIDEKK